MEIVNSTFGNASAAAFGMEYELFLRPNETTAAAAASNGTMFPGGRNFSLSSSWGGEDDDDEYDGGGGWGESQYPSGYSHLGIILTSFFVTVIMIVIVVGNMLVCIAIATEKALKQVQNWFIASLAVSDFLVGLVIMPFSLAKEVMGYWIFGRVWCEIHSALDVFLCTASINSLCLISLDRYWSVTHAVEYLRKRTPKRSIAMICGVWVLSAVISLPPLVGWKKQQRPNASYPECLLSDDVGYVLYSAFGSFYVPAFVMVFVYCRIFVAARSRARRHLKKKHKKEAVTCDLTTNATTNTRSTTTCTTSFSNASPPPTLPKIPESNGTRLLPPPPEIVIEEQDTNSLQNDTQEADPEANGGGGQMTLDIIKNEGGVTLDTKNGGGVALDTSSGGVTFDSGGVTFDTNSLCEASALTRQPPPPPAPPRRFSMLRAPKFLRSPFGSTLSLADMGGSEEDVSGEDTKKNTKKKKKKNPKQKLHEMEEEPPKRQPITTSEAERQRRRVAKAKERRATLILGLIMASFILAWLPFFVLYVLEALCAPCDIGPTGFAVAFWLGYCNSALNPIIYTIFNRDFRRAFRKILFK